MVESSEKVREGSKVEKSNIVLGYRSQGDEGCLS